MAPELPPFIEPPILSKKRPISPSTFLEPPVKVRKASIQPNDFISPPLKVQKSVAYEFIEPKLPAAKKGSRRKRAHSDKPARSRKPREVQPTSFADREGGFGDDGTSLGHDRTNLGNDGTSLGHDRTNLGNDGTSLGHDGISLGHDGTSLGHDGTSLGHDGTSLGDDGGGFGDNGGSIGDCSPEKARDIIDWGITSNEIERLKSQVVPLYWELLLESVTSIVRVTERLYILQDWNNKGYLKVTSQSIILIFEGTPVQACLQNGRHQRAHGGIMRLSTDV
jgi:hypothetical protein